MAIYVYTNKLVQVASREEALSLMKTQRILDDEKVEIIEEKPDKLGLRPYMEYKREYEALLLYIIKRASELYPDYVTAKRVGQIFTVAMLRWYTQVKTSYTGEKPIKAGRIREYNDNIGFKAFKGIYNNVKKSIDFTENNEGWYVLSTDIPLKTIEGLVANKRMIRIMEGAIRECQYIDNSYYRTVRSLYKKLPYKYKVKEQPTNIWK